MLLGVRSDIFVQFGCLFSILVQELLQLFSFESFLALEFSSFGSSVGFQLLSRLVSEVSDFNLAIRVAVVFVGSELDAGSVEALGWNALDCSIDFSLELTKIPCSSFDVGDFGVDLM